MHLDLKKRYAWVFSVVVVVVVAAVLMGIFFLYPSCRSLKVSPANYIVVIDAGSTHTALFVYRWQQNTQVLQQLHDSIRLEQLTSTRCETKGLSNYLDYGIFGRKLETCLRHAMDHVPKELENVTEIHFGGTAGLRMLQSENATSADAFMQAVRRDIQNVSNFLILPESVRIISGEEEGFYGWASANYLADTLSKNMRTGHEDHLFGVLQLGGASTQITFRPGEASVPKAGHYTVKANLFGEELQLYSQSFLCHGLKEAVRAHQALLIIEQDSPVVLDPCLPSGGHFFKTYSQLFGRYCTSQYNTSLRGDFHFLGTSDSIECRKSVSRLFKKARCPYPDHQCSFDGIYQPKLSGKFLAFSGYFYTLKSFRLISKRNSTQETLSLTGFRNATVRHCRRTWQDFNLRNYTDREQRFVVAFCFNAHYVDTILTQGYGFTESSFGNIEFRNNVPTTATF